MDKTTLQTAEQVGLFLLPVVREMVAGMFGKADAELNIRMQRLMDEIGGIKAGLEKATDHSVVRGEIAFVQKRLEQITAEQQDLFGAMQSKAGGERLDTMSARLDAASVQVAEARAAMIERAAEASVVAMTARTAAEAMEARVVELRETLLCRIGEVAEAAVPMLTVNHAVREAIASVRAVHDPQIKAVQDNVVELQQDLLAARTQYEELQATVAGIGEKSASQAEGAVGVAQKIEDGITELRDAVVQARDLAAGAANRVRTLEDTVAANSEAVTAGKAEVVELIEQRSDLVQRAIGTITDSVDAVRTRASVELRALQDGLSAVQIEQSALREQAAAAAEETVARIAAVEQSVSEAAASVEKKLADHTADVAGRISDVYGRAREMARNLQAEALTYVDATIAKLPKIEDLDVSEQFRSMVAHEVDAALPVLQRNLTAEMREQVGAAVEALPAPKDGKDGLLPVADPYIDGETYDRGAVVLHAGGMWQATRRTKSAPGADAGGWQALAVGVAGVAVEAAEGLRQVGLSVRLSDGSTQRSTATVPTLIYKDIYSDAVEYDEHDVVTHDGSLWASREYQNKGVVPGTAPESWRLIVKRGERGRSGKDATQVAPNVVHAKSIGYEGEYAEDKVYEKNAIVSYATSLWMAKRSTKDRPPYLTLQDNEHWLRLR